MLSLGTRYVLEYVMSSLGSCTTAILRPLFVAAQHWCVESNTHPYQRRTSVQASLDLILCFSLQRLQTTCVKRNTKLAQSAPLRDAHLSSCLLSTRFKSLLITAIT